MSFRSPLVRVAAAAAIFTPFALSVAAHAVPDAPRPAPESERPALRFGEYLVNLGRLNEGAGAYGVFRFLNTGETPLTITDLSPSCGCLKPRLDKQTFAAGEAGMFVVEADTAGEATDQGDSLKQHFVDVRYDAGDGPRTSRVFLKFVLPERHVVVEPRSLLVYQFGSEDTRRDITITDRRVPPISVSRVESLDPLLKVEPQLADSTADPRRATITVTIPATLDRDIRTRIVVHTDDPDQPRIQIPIGVQTRSESQSNARDARFELVPRQTVRQ